MKNLKILFLLVLLPAFLMAQSSIEEWTSDYDNLLKTYVSNGRVDYAGINADPQLGTLVTQLANLKPTDNKSAFAKAFYINAYNLVVIYAAATNYPLGSVQEVSGFFERNKYKIGGKKYTLNSFEKDFIFKTFPDPRLHFVLVCGAVGCPPITNFAYQADQLDAQLDMQTKAALNDDMFVAFSGGRATVSKIFQWYNTDFGGSKKNILNYINEFRSNQIPESASIGYFEYDWSLNDQQTVGQSASDNSANAFRYVTSATIPKGQIELKIFNNLYTQKTAENGGKVDSRSTFYTTSISALYGINQRFNLGVDLKYRRTLNSDIPSKLLDVFGSLEEPSGRSGITGIGPRIRWAPIPKWSGFSLQSTFTFAIGDELGGVFDTTGTVRPFIDWNNNIFWTQFFYDKSIGTRFSFFAELDVIWEDIGGFDKLSFPVTTIFSYFPNKKVTLYTLTGFAPSVAPEFDYFHQVGLGTKYQITRRVEVELLYTSFRTKNVVDKNGVASTYNLGVRFSL